MTDEGVRLRFRRRPSPVLPDHRPLYKIGQVLLVLHLASRGGKSRLPRLHLFNWALKSAERRSQLVAAAKNKILNVAAWGFDPALAIAIRYAIAERLLEEHATGYKLSDAGLVFAKELVKDQDLLAQEKRLLIEIGKNITEAMVDEVASGWEAE